MAVALEAVDLVAIAVFMFLLAFLYSLKWTIHPLLSALHHSIGWIPGIGSLIGAADNAIVAALNEGIAGVEEAISTLWAGFVWSLNELVDGLTWFGNEVSAAFEHLTSTTIPNALSTLWHDAQALQHTAGGVVAGVEARIVDAVRQAEHYAAGEASHALKVATGYVDTQLSKYAGAINDQIADVEMDVRAAKSTAQQALDSVTHAVDTVTNTITNTVVHDLPAGASALESEVASIEGAIAGELPALPQIGFDGLRDLLNSQDLTTLVGLLGSVPLLAAGVQALASEIGADSAECRSKLKGVCGSDTAGWFHLLEGLAFGFLWPGLAEFGDAVAEITEEVSGAIVELAGVG